MSTSPAVRDDHSEFANWAPLGLEDLLIEADALRVTIDFREARLAGILYDYDVDTTSTTMIAVGRNSASWSEWTDGKKGEYGSAGRMSGSREVEMRVELEAGQQRIYVANDLVYDWPWSSRTLRGLGYFVDDGRAVFTKLALRKAKKLK